MIMNSRTVSMVFTKNETQCLEGFYLALMTALSNNNKELIMLEKITVEDYVSKKLVTLTAETNVIDAIKTLLDHKITCAPVIDSKGRLVGMFSEIDGMKIFLDSIYNQGMSGKVGDYMIKEIISVDATSSIVDLAEKFEHSLIRSYPVYQDGEFVGVISRVDVLKALVAIAEIQGNEVPS
jgi:CBS domain-containing protein